MREEKKYLVEEAAGYLAQSDYLFVAEFNRLTVADVAALRNSLREKMAEYHVVKNSVLSLAIKSSGLPSLPREALRGFTAIVSGGNDPSGTAKILDAFSNEKGREDKLNLKCGVLSGNVLSANDIVKLSRLPSLGELRSQFLSGLQAAAKNFLLVCNAAMRDIVQILLAQSEKQKNSM
jgi:large subunit ribosomal protein L10